MNLLLIFLQTNVADTAAKIAGGVKSESSMSLWDLTMKGGWLMIPIVFMAVVAVYVFLNGILPLKKPRNLKTILLTEFVIISMKEKLMLQ